MPLKKVATLFVNTKLIQTFLSLYAGVACDLVSLHLQRDFSHMKGLLRLLETELDQKFNQQEEISVFNSRILSKAGSEVTR